MGAPKLQEKYSYADYLTWPDDERWEIIEGEVYSMSPAPGRLHQEILVSLSSFFFTYLKGKPCKVYPAPFDVRLPSMHINEDDIDTVVQPDISIFCNSSKLNDNGAVGAPDLVVEILSESTRNKDLNRKLLLYQKHGVTEYWIVDPTNNSLAQFILDSLGRYEHIKDYFVNDSVSSSIFPDLQIALNEVFINE